MNNPDSITDPQRHARASFDLDAAMAALPHAPPPGRKVSHRGSAGVRLRGQFVATLDEDLLREFARTDLGARRCSEQYFDALRVVLGNQADAERHGYVLEMNQRVAFATPKLMRQIIGQMQAAYISYGASVALGTGRSQVVQCYCRASAALSDSTPRHVAERVLHDMLRMAEATDERRRPQPEGVGADQSDGWHFPGRPDQTIADADLSNAGRLRAQYKGPLEVGSIGNAPAGTDIDTLSRTLRASASATTAVATP